MSLDQGGLTSVAIDVGDGFGALVILADESREGEEIEVEDVDGRRQHAVVHRVGPTGRQAFGAVFPALREGAYRVLDGAQPSAVDISSGSVRLV